MQELYLYLFGPMTCQVNNIWWVGLKINCDNIYANISADIVVPTSGPKTQFCCLCQLTISCGKPKKAALGLHLYQDDNFMFRQKVDLPSLFLSFSPESYALRLGASPPILPYLSVVSRACVINYLFRRHLNFCAGSVVSDSDSTVTGPASTE